MSRNNNIVVAHRVQGGWKGTAW